MLTPTLKKFISRLMVMVMAVSCITPDALRAAVSGGTLSLDERYGRVIDGAYTGGDRLIVYVQDVHCNGGVQRNIHNIIQTFVRAGNLRTVFVEGAPAGPVELRLLAEYPDGPAKSEALGQMLEAGLVSGAEYGALTHGTYPLRGIEDGPLYDENLQRLRRLMAAQPANSAAAGRITRAIRMASRRYQSRDIARLERQLSAAGASKKMHRFTTLLVRRAAESGEDLGRYPEIQRYQRLQTLARELRQSGTAARRAEQFKELQSLKSSFNPQAFYFEQRDLAAALLERRARQPHEKELIQLARLGGMFSALAELKATVKDYEYFARHEWDFYLLLARYCGADAQHAALGILRDQGLMSYYAVNMRRDEHFTRALLGDAVSGSGRAVPAGTAADAVANLQQFRTVDIVIAGGFHDGFVRRLRSSGTSFLTIMPVVASVSPAGELLYREIIAGGMDIRRVVAAATAPPQGDAGLVNNGSFTEKFFAELMKLIQAEVRYEVLKQGSRGNRQVSREVILNSLNAWRARVMNGDSNHPLAQLTIHNDGATWVIAYDGVEMVRANITKGGRSMKILTNYFHDGAEKRPEAVDAALSAWNTRIKDIATRMGATVADLDPAFTPGWGSGNGSSPFRKGDLDVNQFNTEYTNKHWLIDKVLESIDVTDPDLKLTKAFNTLINMPNLIELLEGKKGPAKKGKADAVTIIKNKLKLAELYPQTMEMSWGNIEGFATKIRKLRPGAPATINKYMKSLSMEGVKQHVEAGGRVEFILGHNNPDNDALLSAIVEGFQLTRYAEEDNVLYVPLLCVTDPNKEGFETVTTEVGLVNRELKGMAPDYRGMITSRQVANWLENSTALVKKRVRLGLVDMNELPKGTGLDDLTIVSIKDHHDVPEHETTDLEAFRQIHNAGATLSIIARWSRSLGMPLTEDAMAIMLSGIVDDTKMHRMLLRSFDMFYMYWYGSVVGKDPEAVYKRQNVLSKTPTVEEILADSKEDKYHPGTIMTQHIARRVIKKNKQSNTIVIKPLDVVYDLQEEIFAEMEKQLDQRNKNLYMLMITNSETNETRLWIAVRNIDMPIGSNDTKAEAIENAMTELENVLRGNSDPDADMTPRLEKFAPYDDGRYQIHGLEAPSRKILVPLMKNVLEKYWPETKPNPGVQETPPVNLEFIALMNAAA